MTKLKFLDLKTKKVFSTDKFTIVVKNGRRFASTKAPSGAKAMRLVAKKFKS